ncbi:MAG: cupin [Candidatus Bathyarchaeota archaeon B63]|nr:MAG: cupin [Candidatus Bathyarchaeota archaeon B63]
MKIFSVYDNRKPLERLIRGGEFSGILFVNVHYYLPGESHSIHSHGDREEIFICFQGRGRAITDEGEIDITRGDVLVFKPGESHGFESDEVDPIAYICIGIKTGSEDDQQ